MQVVYERGQDQLDQNYLKFFQSLLLFLISSFNALIKDDTEIYKKKLENSLLESIRLMRNIHFMFFSTKAIYSSCSPSISQKQAFDADRVASNQLLFHQFKKVIGQYQYISDENKKELLHDIESILHYYPPQEPNKGKNNVKAWRSPQSKFIDDKIGKTNKYHRPPWNPPGWRK